MIKGFLFNSIVVCSNQKPSITMGVDSVCKIIDNMVYIGVVDAGVIVILCSIIS